VSEIKKKSYVLIGLLILFIIGMSLSGPTNFLSDIPAQLNTPETSQIHFSNGTLNVSQSFQMLEIAEDNGTKQNVNAVNISLGTQRWNVSELELDITNMTFTKETKIIEDNYTSSMPTHKIQRKAFAVQIKIPVTTRIYQIKIYASKATEATAQIYLQINGYDSQTDKPNSTIYGEKIELNVSDDPNWYIHRYSEPIELSKGDYCLILNGTHMKPSDNGVYNWYLNDEDPKYSDLYRWIYKGNEWQQGETGKPFLYKLDQQIIIEDFYPKEINMTAEINGKNYKIEDKEEKNTGNLSFSDNFFPNSASLSIPIKNNVSDALIVNVSYNIKLNHILPCSGSVFINKSEDNLWTINSTFIRFGYNYTVVYDYPDHWTIIKVYRNSGIIPFGSNLMDNGDLLYIYNSAIPYDNNWKIEATSIRYNLTIDPISDTYDGGETLEFWMRNLPLGGNYTFILVDTNGSEVYNDIKIEPTGEFRFNYSLPSNATTGNWTAYVF
jgi:hypothetical protein